HRDATTALAWRARKAIRRRGHHGSGPSFAWENVPVGPSGPSSAMRTASAAPSSTVSVPSYALRFVLVKPGETALTLIPVDSSSIAIASVIALSAVFDAA